MSQAYNPGQFAAPPRTVEAPLAGRMLMGGAWFQIACLVLLMGSIFFWGVFLHSDFVTWRFALANVATTTGQFLYCRETTFAQGGSRSRRGVPILEVRYRYTVGIHSFEGSSYAVGGCPGGEKVVEYLASQPAVSRIAGLRSQPFGKAGMVVGIVPLTGLVMLLFALRQGGTRLALLRDGVQTTGKLVEMVRTNVQANNRTVYRLVFEFTAQNGTTARVTTRTNSPRRFEDQAGVPLLYDREKPARAVLLSSLPGAIVSGEMRQPVSRAPKAYLILPALLVLGNAWYVLRHF